MEKPLRTSAFSSALSALKKTSYFPEKGFDMMANLENRKYGNRAS
ncbi:MAG: hypothetical protein U7123_15365 [Potamolinea sp.]